MRRESIMTQKYNCSVIIRIIEREVYTNIVIFSALFFVVVVCWWCCESVKLECVTWSQICSNQWIWLIMLISFLWKSLVRVNSIFCCPLNLRPIRNNSTQCQWIEQKQQTESNTTPPLVPGGARQEPRNPKMDTNYHRNSCRWHHAPTFVTNPRYRSHINPSQGSLIPLDLSLWCKNKNEHRINQSPRK